jgi:predicted nucleic acid-binding protein
MTFLLDSTTLIAWWRGTPVATVRWLADRRGEGDRLGVSTVNVTELFTGAHPAARERLRAFFAALEVWHTTAADAEWAGIRRYELARQGFTTHLEDATIAAVARRVGATVVTDNTRDFETLGVPVLRPGA